MALLYSLSSEIGKKLPEIKLKDTTGTWVDCSSFGESPILIMFICAHCPYVLAIEDRFLELSVNYGKDIQFIGICSNDSTQYPEDSSENLHKRVIAKKYTFPYLIDEDQTVAKEFNVACTPEFFLFSSEKKLVYHGRLDDSWKDPNLVTSSDLQDAIEALLKGKEVTPNQFPSMGCSIKWK